MRFGLAILTVALFSVTANADEGATAQALFDEGRKLASEGRCAEANAKFAASLRMLPTVGAYLNYGDCAEKLGLSATAWGKFLEAAALAKRKNDDRETYARTRAATVEAVLSRLTIHNRHPGSVTLRRDDVVVDAAMLDVALPIDPGDHVIEATAPNHAPFRKTVHVPKGPASLTVDVPPLEPLVSAPKSAATDETGWTSQRTVAVSLAGAGVVGLAVGAFFGLRARSLWNDANSHCDETGCTPDDVAHGTQAHRYGNVSTIAFVGGAALLASGAVVWFTAPTARTKVGAAGAPGSLSLTIAAHF